MPLEPAALTYSDIILNQRASFDVTITSDLIQNFADLSGDYSPIHVDPTFAASTAFGSNIAHGMSIGMYFSRLIGMHLPGRHALYLSQTLNFRKPILPGTEVTIVGEVIQKIDAVQTLKIKTQACTSSGEVLVDGEALVKVLI